MSHSHDEAHRRIGLPMLLLLAVVSGVLHVCALPPLDLGGLAFVALVPLLVGLRLETRRWPTASAGFAFGLVSVVGVVHWIPAALIAGNGFGAGAAWLLATLVFGWFALWFALFPWAVSRLDRGWLPDALSPPLAWVAIETLRDALLPGLSWTLLGHSQHAVLPTLQLAELGGAPGLSFLLVWVNALLADAVVGVWQRRPHRRIVVPSGVAAALVAVMFVGGGLRLAAEDRARAAALDAAIPAAAVQIAVPQAVRWQPEFAWPRIDALLRASRGAARSGARLIVWPETAIEIHLDKLEGFAAAHARTFSDRPTGAGPWLIAGAPREEPEGAASRFYNSAAVFDGEGDVVEVYDKRVLYPISEYVPGWMLAIPGAPRVLASQLRWAPYSPGQGEDLLIHAPVPVGVMICFEGIRSDAGRERVHAGAEVLAQLANDAVIPDPAAVAQHFAIARFRAVENRRPLVRASNLGVTAIVAASGRMIGRTGPEPVGIASGRVVPARGSTPFGLLGWVGPWACVAVAVGVALLRRGSGPPGA